MDSNMFTLSLRWLMVVTLSVLSAPEVLCGQAPDAFTSALERAKTALYAHRFADMRKELDAAREVAPDVDDRGLTMRSAALSYLHEGDPDRSLTELRAVIRAFEV